MTPTLDEERAYHAQQRKVAERVSAATGWGLPDGWAIGPVGRHRDSDVLQESNFSVACQDLHRDAGPERGPYDDDDDATGTWEVVRFGHWAVGWVEEIAYRIDGPAATAACRIAGQLEVSAVLDEMDYSEREYEAALSGIGDWLRYEHDDDDRQVDPHDIWEYLFHAGMDLTDLRHDDLSVALDHVLSHRGESTDEAPPKPNRQGEP